MLAPGRHPGRRARELLHSDVARARLSQVDPSSIAHQQNKAAGAFVQAPGVRHELMANPVLLSTHKAFPRGGAPKVGEHTFELLAELGVPNEEAEALRRDGVGAVSKGARKPRGGAA